MCKQEKFPTTLQRKSYSLSEKQSILALYFQSGINCRCILKYFLYLCTRFTSKVWIKTEIDVVINTVIDVSSPYFLHPKTG